MATYTDNYSLTKPTFAEVADIRTINGNMDTIDDIMHASQVSLADAYDQTATYNTGDVVMYEFLMYKCKEDNVTGNWDATKWERTTAAETGGGEIDFDLFGEASGNPASFADGASAGLAKCITEITPKQDLHGYSKPWAGGAGKNKLNLADIVTPSAGFVYNREPINVEVNTYTLSFNFIGTSGAISISLRNGETIVSTLQDQPLVNGLNTYTMPTLSNNADSISLYSSINGTYEDFMIEIGSQATTYEPYANICPIGGHSSVTINVSPTNDPSQGVDTIIQFGDTYYGGTLNAVTGELVVNMATITMDGVNNAVTGKISSQNTFYMQLDGMKRVADYRGHLYSDTLETYELRTQLGSVYGISGSLTNISTSYLYMSNGGESTSVNDFNTWLQSNNVQVCYELATPITVQIPPTTINTLLGQNYISSEDAEDIDLIYTKSTAPIKPNPSGTPSGELRSIEIGGEIFEIIKELPTFPTSDGDYKLKLSVSSGVSTLSWVSDT